MFYNIFLQPEYLGHREDVQNTETKRKGLHIRHGQQGTVRGARGLPTFEEKVGKIAISP